MNEFNYSVVIRGLDGVPLRTSSSGAKSLLKSFHAEPQMENLLLEAINDGRPFSNPFITISHVDKKPEKLMSVAFASSAISSTKTAKKKTAKKTTASAVGAKKPTKKKASRYS